MNSVPLCFPMQFASDWRCLPFVSSVMYASSEKSGMLDHLSILCHRIGVD